MVYKQSGLMAIHQQNHTQIQLVCTDRNRYDISNFLGKLQGEEIYEFGEIPAGIYDFQVGISTYCFILHQTLAGGDRLYFRDGDLRDIWVTANLNKIDVIPYRIINLLNTEIATLTNTINGSLDAISIVAQDYISSPKDAERSWINPIPHVPTVDIRYIAKQNEQTICDKIISLKDELLAIQTLRDIVHIDRANQLALFEKYLGFLYLTGDEKFQEYELDEDSESHIFYCHFPEVARKGQVRCSHFQSISIKTLLRNQDLMSGVAIAGYQPNIGFKVPKKYVKDLDDFRRQLREKYNDPDQEPVTVIYEYAKPRTYHKMLDDYEFPIAMGDNQIRVFHPTYPDVDLGKMYFYKSLNTFSV